MKVSDFDYDLPEELIAQHPPEARADSRLLCVGEEGALDDRTFRELPGFLGEGDLLVINDTRVIPARLYGQKETGGRVEILVERVQEGGQLVAQVRASKTPREGMQIFVDGPGGATLTVDGRRGEFFALSVQGVDDIPAWLEDAGHTPLPPYIQRPESDQDLERYQTVYATSPGAVAAPTAGLHFDEVLLEEVRRKGVDIAPLTLHVGAGTFQPVRTDAIELHVMHSELVSVSGGICNAICETRRRGGRVVAVGTTVVRALETAALQGELQPFEGETDIFIFPGFEFRVVDMLLTNFHLPRSTLLMLVSAFAGTERVLAAYQHAVAEGYRFFSYGDAMLLTARLDPADTLPA